MNSLGSRDFYAGSFVRAHICPELIPAGTVGSTPSINRIRFRQCPTTSVRNVYTQRYKTLSTELGESVRVKSPGIDQDICFDDVVGDILKEIEDRFGGALKRKIMEDIQYAEAMETAFLSESALAKDWLCPEEDEAWKDL